MTTSALPAGLLALGVALGGWFVGHGFTKARTIDRYVTVKGVAEQEVEADLALWPLRVVATGNDLAGTQAQIDRSARIIVAYLARAGIDTSQVELQGLEVTDVHANAYRENQGGTRFIITQTLMVRSTDPRAIQAASQRAGQLVESGVVLSSGTGYGPARPTFLFTTLNDVKPAMIAAATAEARAAAEKFAADSRSSLGGIRTANQGVFVILPRDQAPGVSEGDQLLKTVRVVTTVEYYLED